MVPCQCLLCCHLAVLVVKKVMAVCHQDLILICQQHSSLKGTVQPKLIYHLFTTCHFVNIGSSDIS